VEEKVDGLDLMHFLTTEPSTDRVESVMHSVFDAQLQLLRARVPAFGSIIFDDDKRTPIVGPFLPDDEINEPALGPWQSVAESLEYLLSTEVSRLNAQKAAILVGSRTDSPIEDRHRFSAFLDGFALLLKAVQCSDWKEFTNGFRLCHSDFNNPSNILLSCQKPDHFQAVVIDWSRAAPLPLASCMAAYEHAMKDICDFVVRWVGACPNLLVEQARIIEQASEGTDNFPADADIFLSSLEKLVAQSVDAPVPELLAAIRQCSAFACLEPLKADFSAFILKYGWLEEGVCN